MSEQAADDYSSLPGEHVSIDQIVAGNIRHWRRAAGLTQKELGERLGWTDANVSAAERSRVAANDPRRFDATTLAMLARALGLPIAALLLPPEDDGVSKRYQFDTAEGDCLGMASLLALVVSDPPPNDETALMDEYRERYQDALMRYFDYERGEELAAHLEDLASAERRKVRLERLRWQRGALAAVLDDIDRIVDAIADAEAEQ